MEAPVRGRRGQRGAHPQGVQHQLAMAEIDTLGVARGAGRVERGGTSVFIEIGKGEVGRTGFQQGFVFTFEFLGQIKRIVDALV